jgi:Na+-driven multidrug efflux pump
MSLTGLLMLAMPYALVTLFLDPALPANRGVIPLAASFLIVAAFFQIFDGAQVVAAGMLRGLQDTKVPMIYAGIGYWVIGLATGVGLGFGLGWEGVGIWIGLAAGLASVAVLLLARWINREACRKFEFGVAGGPIGVAALPELTGERRDHAAGCDFANRVIVAVRDVKRVVGANDDVGWI